MRTPEGSFRFGLRMYWSLIAGRCWQASLDAATYYGLL